MQNGQNGLGRNNTSRKRTWLFSVVAVAALLGACDGAPVDQAAGEVTTGEDVNALSPDVTPRCVTIKEGGATSCKDEKTWRSYGEASCKAKGLALKNVMLATSCGMASWREATYTCCDAITPPPPPPPPPPPGMCFTESLKDPMGTCVDDSTWKTRAEAVCKAKSATVKNLTYGTVCRASGATGHFDDRGECCGPTTPPPPPPLGWHRSLGRSCGVLWLDAAASAAATRRSLHLESAPEHGHLPSARCLEARSDDVLLDEDADAARSEARQALRRRWLCGSGSRVLRRIDAADPAHPAADHLRRCGDWKPHDVPDRSGAQDGSRADLRGARTEADDVCGLRSMRSHGPVPSRQVFLLQITARWLGAPSIPPPRYEAPLLLGGRRADGAFVPHPARFPSTSPHSTRHLAGFPLHCDPLVRP